MSIITHERGSFLQIDRTSVQDTVGQTLRNLGIGTELESRTSLKRSKDPTKQGFRLFDTYKLDVGMKGPAGESMKALLKISDVTAPGQTFRVQLGIYRLVCLNGLFGFGTAFETRIVHRTGEHARELLRALPDAIVGAVGGIGALQDEANRLAGIQLTNPWVIVRDLKIPENTREHVLNIMDKATYRAVDAPFTAWGLYNLVNEVDRLLARRGSNAYANRDESLVQQIISKAA